MQQHEPTAPRAVEQPRRRGPGMMDSRDRPARQDQVLYGGYSRREDVALQVLLKLVDRADSPMNGELEGWANGLAKASILVADSFWDRVEAPRE